MAMQAGLGVSRILIIVGAGYTGTILLQKGKLSDLLAELQSLLKANGKDGESEGDSDAVAAQIRTLAAEVRKLASGRTVTVLNGGSGHNGLASLVVPAAVLAALGYGFMKWKAITFSDLMYVTKRNMEAAVTNLTKQLGNVSDLVAGVKRHVIQKIENLDERMENQLEMSKQIKNDISEVRDDISQFTYVLDAMEKTVYALGDKMESLDDKQDVANAGVLYLCGLVHGKKMKLPERIQAEINVVANSVPSLMGLKDVVDALEVENNSRRSITDGISGNGIESLNDRPRTLFRRASIKG